MRRLRATTKIVTAALALASSGSVCNNFTQPEPDSCDVQSSSAGVTMLEVGPGLENPSNGDEERAFVAWHDGERATTLTGGQGSPMLPVRYRVTGTSLPTCLLQTTMVVGYGASAAPLKTYAQPDGSRATKTLYLVLNQSIPTGGMFEVRASVGAISARRVLYSNYVPTDAGP